jgi:hypothetical protein
MKRLVLALMVVSIATAQTAAARQTLPDDPQALRAHIEERFDIVPLTNGLALRPKNRTGDVRLIEVSDGAILVNGAPVTGRELRDRIGRDADVVLRLSYLSAADRASLLQPPAVPPPAPDAEPPLEAPAPRPAPGQTERERRTNPRSAGDRVRVFGNVSVAANEHVGGQVVAVLGSAHIDGEVRDQVVAVLGSVNLGPKAIVRGDVVSVGGRVRRAEGAQILGAVTEVSLSEPNVGINFEPLVDWRGVYLFDRFAAFPRLIGTTFRFLLLVLLVCMALVVARPTVEASAQRVADRPVQTTIIGMVAQLLLVPLLVLTVIVLAISIIGIPLLLLIPFAVLALLLLALAGFSGTVFAVGQWSRRRMGLTSAAPFVDVCLGLAVILLPVLVGRLLALAGWPATPFAFLLLAVGFVVEVLAWSSGFGAVLTNGFSRWQAHRASRSAVAS